MWRLLMTLAVLTAGTALLGACGGSGDRQHDMAGMDHAQSSEVQKGARPVAVEATAFRFDASEIRARVGESVAIVLTSRDLLHDFTIDELGAHVAAEPDTTETGGLTATKAGRYTYYCSVPGHRGAGMEGTLVVE